VRQILLNLLSNAVKFNGEGCTVSVDCAIVAAGWLRISVNDTGPGIAADEMDQLFVPFSRLSAKVEGTGIGLTISKRLVELMGGRIGVDSNLGEGSAFWIELPLFEPDPAT
jgi:signal transduction histidine kinase